MGRETKEEIGEREEGCRRSPGDGDGDSNLAAENLCLPSPILASPSRYVSPEVEEVGHRALFPPIRRSSPSYPVLVVVGSHFPYGKRPP